MTALGVSLELEGWLMKESAKDTNIVRTTIRVPRKLWDSAKIRAIEEHMPVQDLVIKALENFVRKGGRS